MLSQFTDFIVVSAVPCVKTSCNKLLPSSCNITIEKSRFSADLYTMLEQKENHLTYVSTKQSGFNLFCDSVFVPQWKEESFPYRSVIEINPFMKDGSINRYFLENSVDSFFKNLESDWNLFIFYINCSKIMSISFIFSYRISSN